MCVQFQQVHLVWVFYVSVASSSHAEDPRCANVPSQEEACHLGSSATQGHSLLQADFIVKGGRSASQRVKLTRSPAAELRSQNLSLLQATQMPLNLKAPYEAVKLKLTDMFGDVAQLDWPRFTLFMIGLCVFLFCLICFFISALCPESEPTSENEFHFNAVQCSTCQQIFGMPPGHANFSCPRCGTLHRFYSSGVYRAHIGGAQTPL